MNNGPLKYEEVSALHSRPNEFFFTRKDSDPRMKPMNAVTYKKTTRSPDKTDSHFSMSKTVASSNYMNPFLSKANSSFINKTKQS